MAAVAVLSMVSLASNRAPLLGPGDTAPPLSVSACMGGDAELITAKQRVTVISWWDPLEPRSRELERVVRLADAIGDVSVVALCGEDAVTTFEVACTSVPTWAVGRPVAFGWDDGSRTRRAFLGTDERDPRESTVLVDADGTIAWIGDESLVAEPLHALVDGTWDIEDGVARMHEFRERRAIALELGKDDPATALERLEVLAADYPRLESVTLHARYIFATRIALHDRTRELGNRLIENAADGGRVLELTFFARYLVEPSQRHAERYLDLAYSAASKAVELSAGECGDSLACLARVRYWQDEFASALELQERAVATSSGRSRDRFERTLDEYRGLVAVPGEDSSD